MLEKATSAVVSEHELSEMRSLLEQRSGILFDVSRERFFSIRVREHMSEKKMAHGSELLRVIRGSNVEYDKFLERLLTQETSFNRYPAIFRALEKKVLPEMHVKKSGRIRGRCGFGARGARREKSRTRLRSPLRHH